MVEWPVTVDRPRWLTSERICYETIIGCYSSDLQFKGCGEISKSFWTRLLKSAKERGIEVTTTLEEIWQLFLTQEKRCALTGIELRFQRNYSNRNQTQTASLNRKDPSQGYSLSNIQWVHKDINRMKQQFKQQEFIRWCRMVAKNKEDV